MSEVQRALEVLKTQPQLTYTVERKGIFKGREVTIHTSQGPITCKLGDLVDALNTASKSKTIGTHEISLLRHAKESLSKMNESKIHVKKPDMFGRRARKIDKIERRLLKQADGKAEVRDEVGKPPDMKKFKKQ